MPEPVARVEALQDRQIEPGDAEQGRRRGSMHERPGKHDAAEHRRSPVDAPHDCAQPGDDHQRERRLDHDAPISNVPTNVLTTRPKVPENGCGDPIRRSLRERLPPVVTAWFVALASTD
jgi:hypothetical protein